MCEEKNAIFQINDEREQKREMCFLNITVLQEFREDDRRLTFLSSPRRFDERSGRGTSKRPRQTEVPRHLSLHSVVRTARRGPDGHWIYPATRFSTPRTLTLIRPYSNHPFTCPPDRKQGAACRRFSARGTARSRDESSTCARDQCPVIFLCAYVDREGHDTLFDLSRLVPRPRMPSASLLAKAPCRRWRVGAKRVGAAGDRVRVTLLHRCAWNTGFTYRSLTDFRVIRVWVLVPLSNSFIKLITGRFLIKYRIYKIRILLPLKLQIILWRTDIIY